MYIKPTYSLFYCLSDTIRPVPVKQLTSVNLFTKLIQLICLHLYVHDSTISRTRTVESIHERTPPSTTTNYLPWNY